MTFLNRVGVNSILEFELQLNSHSNSGIGIQIGVLKILELELELKTGIDFLHLLVNQTLPNFSFDRGHDLSCDWLLMWCMIASLWWSHKRHMDRVPLSYWVDWGIKGGDTKYQLTTMTQTKLFITAE